MALHVLEQGNNQVHCCNTFTHIFSIPIDFKDALYKLEHESDVCIALTFTCAKHAFWVAGNEVLESYNNLVYILNSEATCLLFFTSSTDIKKLWVQLPKSLRDWPGFVCMVENDSDAVYSLFNCIQAIDCETVQQHGVDYVFNLQHQWNIFFQSVKNSSDRCDCSACGQD